MEINLLEVIKYNKKCLQDKALLCNIIADKYPTKIKERNVLLNVYDIGVIRDIACNGSITELQYNNYIQKLINTYGLQEQLAIQGINTWIDVFLGNGYSARFTSTSKTGVNNELQKVIGNIDDYELTMLSDTTAEIKAFVGMDVDNVVVPAVINGIRIVGIGEGAYRGYKGIKRLIVSEGIDYIKDAAFLKCSCLEKVVLPTSLIELGRSGGEDKMHIDGTFGGCESLSEITIPSTVTKIGKGSFMDCKSLCSVQLNEGLTEIGECAFKGCESLSNITMPSTVTKMGTRVFSGCKNLRSVQVNAGLTEIGKSTFRGCESLLRITVPSTVTKISTASFAGCKSLKEVKLNEGLIQIEEYAFYGCESLLKVTMPNTVTEIGNCAFKGCKNLFSVQLNEGLIEIGEEAFEDCEEFLRIRLPSTVTTVDNSRVFLSSEKKDWFAELDEHAEATLKKLLGLK